MADHVARVQCPTCGDVHEVVFSFWIPRDGERETEEVDCECGTSFGLVCTAEVEVDYYVGDPENVTLPDEPEDDPDQPCVSRDSNQSSIL